MKTSGLNTALTAAAFSLALSAASQASAGQANGDFATSEDDGTQSIRIEYARAQLATDDGLDMLYRKIKRAAAEICGPRGLREAGGLSNASRNRKCYEEAVGAAVSQVGSTRMAGLSY
jgi:UrcA family protein